MKILLLSPYDTLSHRRWREGLLAHFSGHEWTVKTLPPRHFQWRMRGNALTWWGEDLNSTYDAMVATSMTDLATLRGIVPALAQLPALLYFHENQFAYPLSDDATPRLEPQMVQLYSALSAQRLAFNSKYNRSTFFEGLQALLKRLPDGVPAGTVKTLEAKSTVLPVPVGPEWFEVRQARSGDRLTLLWNHRWEYDKGPDRLLLAVRVLLERGINFRLHITGQRFRNTPAEFKAIRDLLGASTIASLGHFGPVEDDEAYRKLLGQCHVVLSTALHDFQGLAVLEAVAAGCLPLVPDRLAYPEWFGPEWRYESCLDDPQREAQALVEQLAWHERARLDGTCPGAPCMDGFRREALGPGYNAVI